MVTYKIGGKKGQVVKLRESDDLVVIRFKEDKNIDDIKLNTKSRSLKNKLMLVASFPEANVDIFRCNSTGSESSKQVRNEVRKTFSKKEDIHFAGRVLTDESGALNLYTENLFIKFHDSLKVKECKLILQEHELTIKKKVKYAKNAFFVKAEDGVGMKVFGIASKLLKSKEVEFCHPELIKQRKFKEIHKQQWHLKKAKFNGQVVDAHIDVKEAWKHTKGKGVIIAVIDDGVDIDHVEFKGENKIVAPRDIMQENSDPRPKFRDDNHGTPCAGVACASGNKSASGVAPEATLMPIRLRAGLGSMKEADAFEWATENGADVISCSWGPTDGPWWDPDHPIHTRKVALPDSTRLAIDYAVNEGRDGKGCVITWAAGNGRENTFFDGYASYGSVLAIAACNDRGSKSIYSDFGKEIMCAFPSSDIEYLPFNHPKPLTPGIWTTDNLGSGGYNQGLLTNDPNIGDKAGHYTADFGGTSSSCPGVAGVVALMLSLNPSLRIDAIKNIIKISCDKIDEENAGYNADGHSIYYGYGRLNAKKAIAQVLNTISINPSLELSGILNFYKNDEVAISKGKTIKSKSKNDRLTGMAISISPSINDLSIQYQLSYNNIGTIPIQRDGAQASLNDRRRKVIGFSIKLSGKKSSKYSIMYRAKFNNQSDWISASDGKFCGKKSGKGPSIQEVWIDLKPI